MTRDGDLARRVLQARSSRLVAVGRLGVAPVIAVALWLDPARDASPPPLAVAAVAAYLALAAAGAWLQRAAAPRRLWGLPVMALDLPAHVLELAAFAVLLHATDALASPFFPLSTLSILAAALRWGWRGALWTAVAVLLVLVAAMAERLRLGAEVLPELDRFLIRSAQVGVLGAVLVLLSVHLERLRDEMLRLGAWSPGPEPTDLTGRLAAGAAHAAEVFGGARGARVVLVAQDRDEPGAVLVRREGESLREERPGPDQLDLLFGPQEDPDGSPAGTGRMGGRHDRELLGLSAGGRFERRPAPASWAALAEALGVRHLLSVPFGTDRYEGRLLILDHPDLTAEDLLVAALVARQVEAGLDRLGAVEAQRRAAAGDERVRMARDLHDGVLQTLSATAMHLAALTRSDQADPARLAALQVWLEREARELRGLIGRLRSEDAADEREGAAALADLARGLERQWGLRLRLSLHPPSLVLDPAEAFQARLILREAAANAARHGRASRLDAELWREDGSLRLRLADDGAGLGLEGEFDAERLRRLGLGPRNLRERVVALGGDFALRSGHEGLRLDIALPAAGARATA